MSTDSGRKVCPSCGNLLAHSAYHRHLADRTGSVCPGKMNIHLEEENSSEASFGSDHHSDSSFDFGCSSPGECAGMINDSIEEVECGSSMSFSDSEVDDSLSSGEEIWESESEDEHITEFQQTANEALLGISVFLNFFQLAFRVSERAISVLLMFLRTLIIYFATFSVDNSVLKILSEELPKSASNVRSISKKSDELTKYVVCLKCHHLYVHGISVQ